MATILLAGGSGLIGRRLSKLLGQRGHRVIVLTRQRNRQAPGMNYAYWDPAQPFIERVAIEQADYIIQLAGAGVAEKRWTTQRKKEILSSRVESSGLLVQALRDIPNQVKAVISSSAIGWYGPDPAPGGAFVETDPPDTGFLGETCRLWEQSIQPVSSLGKRLVILRTGIVLTPEGGALAEFKKPLAAGVAAILGNGRQVVSWIHIEDMCRIFLFALENDQLSGVFNAVAPQPVTNRELTLELARKVRGNRFLALGVPAWVLKIALGEMSVEVLKSARVSPGKIQAAGFAFHYPDIHSALGDLLTTAGK